ncbi:tryptophan--tRNA ligase [Saccharomonospora viridis]|jgi:tryptophanyl-tRNA synthetase|uniref:Tryptophan--tRNA ligase n=1 Tax=Saccharomonospora viridis (strain ATCC 15386 / DSM 43017 / JCM 3036 / CCUG 5913 / NBRC 12207 / NCIMB 9602 / P101) TaxID=471857 RepID=C7MZJ9_SACVD|nr:tryptophan--tRNA ligase [Saccharomonospora viridis]ACU98228.1 tryptophanyl-tRNA synthetase [Saccharomonospora viridis DSM 43017]
MSEPAAKVSLTGIKPSGEVHLGNLVGAIRPALRLAEQYDSLYFIADYHALTSIRDPELLRHYSRSVAASWLAAGLDPARTTFYVQSDVPEIFELNWILSCVTGKGLMNRAHAYKAARDRNIEAGEDPDVGVNMGLYNYPILMAVDILIMEADVVPVGKDQVQHVEYAADIAGSFNHLYGDSYSFKIPEAIIPESGSGDVLPGLDGRKMSKSYDNTIPLFLPENKLKKLVRRIPTDSTPVEEPKDPDSSAVFQILEQFAPDSAADVVADTRKRLQEGGMGWGELKNILFEVLNSELAPMREKYNAYMEPGSELDDVLARGAERARERASRVLSSVRKAIGVD